MAEEAPLEPQPAPPAPAAEDGGFVKLFLRLIDDVERFIRAELRLWRAQVYERLRQARTAIILIVAGFLIAQSAFIAFLVGLLIILRQEAQLSPALATLIVVGTALLIAGGMIQVAILKIKKLTEIREKADRK
ncbi:phage holin family protein [Sphingomonas immobilis]|uniref:Phage holin family protein n=1 Tax=Sphingomonas immobilis TaxID=3063997 RepID=A0ABT8ZV99_9SPHN|nr:phage holin family protein [Sphingomonas sp. CA1-15]MDO7841188.1 phage holin family protein [Sphingomonas sp. CA1-15]